MIAINTPFIILENKLSALIFEKKSFDDSRAAFIKGRYYLVIKYFGPKKHNYDLKEEPQKINFSGSSNDYNYDLVLANTFGNGNNCEGSLLIENADKTYTNRFFFKEAKYIKGGVDMVGPHTRHVTETLEIIDEDIEAGLELHHYISLLDDSSIFVFKRKLVNLNKESVRIKNLASVEINIPSTNLLINTYDGAWLFERYRHQVSLTSGIFVNESCLGSSSHKHNPFMEIKDETNNLYFATNLIYSGNHKEIVEIDSRKNAAFKIGINNYLFDYELKGHNEFITPEAIVAVSDCSFDEASKEMRSFVINHIVPDRFKNKTRPILFNSWEGNAFNINETKLLDMAKKCQETGIELFVVDDGWFKGRVNEYKALGDWEVDKERFPNGLGELANKIRAMGLEFGFWVEPEMISADSDLYRSHPEYACVIPHREPLERRHQFIIDMSNPNVVDYLFNSISNVIEETKPYYIKWDYNRAFSDSYSSYGTPAGEFNYKFIYGTYSLIEKLTNKYPNIIFESCSSGGGRYDLGMFYYMPQCWGSDDSNAYVRSFISCGTFQGYHQSTFGAHVSVDGCPIPNENHRSYFEDRFNLQCVGAFGYEFDITRMEQNVLDMMKTQIEFYRKHRDLIQFGNLETIDNVFDNSNYYSLSITNNDKTEAIYLIVETAALESGRTWKLPSLNLDTTYIIKERECAGVKKAFDTLEISGKELRDNGMNLDSLFSYHEDKNYPGINSKLFYIKKK